jgi:hypothetical protein
VAADQFDEFVGLCLAAAAPFDELVDARFHNTRHATIGKALSRNVLPLIDGAKRRLAGAQVAGPSIGLQRGGRTAA